LATGANLIFTASRVDNRGALTLSNTTGLPAGASAGLHASIDDSTIASLSITQTGKVPAYVELGNDSTIVGSVAGPVTISEGVGNADKIILDKLAGGGDTFGSTTLIQGAGPAFAGGDGNDDSTSASGIAVKDVTIDELLNGNGDSITVNAASVALTCFGVATSQGNGDGDTVTITGVTSPIPTNPGSVAPHGPPSILISQGNGNADSASVTTATLAGNITIKQGIGNGDTARVSDVRVGFKVSSGGNTETFFGNVTINQGAGTGNTASVDTANSVILGKITIT
jgi:hypothetical protein